MKNILAIIGVLFCIAWADKAYEESTAKQEIERFWEKVGPGGTERLSILIDEVYND